MRHRNVGDLMTTSVARVREDASFREIVKVLSDNDVTAVPVVDDYERPLGVVSEADLLRRETLQPDPTGLLGGRDTAYGRAGGDVAGAAATSAHGLMSAPAITARPDWAVVQAARIMEDHQVKRLPVVDEAGRLVGVVSRADLLRVFLRHDRAIREEITGDVLDRTLRLAPGEIAVRVEDGRVRLHGTVGRPSLIPVVVRLCQGVDGVVEVTADLGFLIAEETREETAEETTEETSAAADVVPGTTRAAS